MAVDPEYQTGVPQSTLDAYREQGDADQGIRPYDDTALWAHHPRVLATQGAERRLLQSIQRLHNHPENADGGILMWDLLDRAEELGLDSQTALRALGGDLVEEVVLKPR